MPTTTMDNAYGNVTISEDLQDPPELLLHTYPDLSLGIVKYCIDLSELALFFNF